MKLLFAVMTCPRDSVNGNQDVVSKTWLAGIKNHAFFTYPEPYESLPRKVQAACQFAIQEKYDVLFKCDVDTYVRPEKFHAEEWTPSLLEYISDYYGFVLTGETYCSGGAGYLLSRKAMEIVANAEIDDTLEDRWVGKVLAKASIAPLHSQSFMPWRVPITKSNDVISVHLSKATGVYDKQDMYDVHKEWEAST